jgi:1-aminocyclopropane-1-carboxylate deaminase
MTFDTSNSKLQLINHPFFNSRNIQLYVKRDDLIHSEVSGNKWRKLKYNIQQSASLKKECILTFGGAYSNHLIATASACNQLNLMSVGIVRGEELNPFSNAVLERCHQLGMQLHFVPRSEYDLRAEKEYWEELTLKFPSSFIIPEGGANYFGMIGCQEIWKEIDVEINHVFVSQGTSTTSCGLILGARNSSIHVLPALKGYDSRSEMNILLSKAAIESELIDELLNAVIIHNEYHFGGYAKSTKELEDFIIQVKEEMDLPLDNVYTSKAFFGMMQEIKKGGYENETVLFVHTGGYYKS